MLCPHLPCCCIVHLLVIFNNLRNEDEPPNIEDPDAVKPEDWLDDESEYIPDPNAKKPEDW